jgi:hypothetical protein
MMPRAPTQLSGAQIVITLSLIILLTCTLPVGVLIGHCALGEA